MPPQTETPLSHKKRAGVTGPFQFRDQPLVTIGAGALPLPTKQPAKLKEATTNASAKAVFFIRFPHSDCDKTLRWLKASLCRLEPIGLLELVVDAENDSLDMRLVARIAAQDEVVRRRPVA